MSNHIRTGPSYTAATVRAPTWVRGAQPETSWRRRLPAPVTRAGSLALRLLRRHRRHHRRRQCRQCRQRRGGCFPGRQHSRRARPRCPTPYDAQEMRPAKIVVYRAVSLPQASKPARRQQNYQSYVDTKSKHQAVCDTVPYSCTMRAFPLRRGVPKKKKMVLKPGPWPILKRECRCRVFSLLTQPDYPLPAPTDTMACEYLHRPLGVQRDELGATVCSEVNLRLPSIAKKRQGEPQARPRRGWGRWKMRTSAPPLHRKKYR